LTAVALSTDLGIVISSTAVKCLVHNMHTGYVVFGFDGYADTAFEHVAISSKGYVIAAACATKVYT
jgi:hypothetical protein